MAKSLTPHQRGIVKRYYENKNNIMAQKLSEAVSDLYVCSDAKKAAKLWKKAHTAMKNLPIPPRKASKCVENQDIQELARILEEVF